MIIMLIALIIVSVLLVAASAIIFYLWQVLKNNFEVTNEIITAYNYATKTAHDGKYYPATIIAKTEYGQPQAQTIVDWSLYESRQIVVFVLHLTETIEECFDKKFLESLDEEQRKIVEQSTIIRKAIVYAPKEGEWLWK